MLRKILLLVSVLGFYSLVSAQDAVDSTDKVLDEVVVTGTRTENKVRNLPMPIQVISAKTIEKTGIDDLLQILQMQTGLVVAVNPLGVSLQGYPNPFGSGIQMQGLDPAYSLVLVDGEPLTGRNGGILNLSRISTANISRIEILRGPATSLYGSDALAGVINIITRVPEKNTLNGRVQYGSNNAIGVTLSGSVIAGKTSIQLLGRRHQNNGWDLDNSIYGKTIDPFTNYSFDVKTTTNFDKKNSLTVSARYFHNKQDNNYLIDANGKPGVINGNTYEEDKSLYAKWDRKINDRLNFVAGVYTTGYDNYSNAFLKSNDSLYEKITFNQYLIRPEVQVNIGHSDQLLVAGAGYNYETVNSSRYGQDRELDSWFLFLQKQFIIGKKINVIAGGRYDKNSLYPAQFSPKLAAGYKLNSKLILKASVGAGFKAPDFRQQFLDFSNSLVGYTIIGARELGNGLMRLKKTGLLAESTDISAYVDGLVLSPERSVGYNLGVDYTHSPKLFFQLNFFRNDVNHLIETYNLPFNQTNGKTIFSYKNIDRVFTEGAELNVNYTLNKNWKLATGYNFLIAKDKDVIDEIRKGKLYRRDPNTSYSHIVTLKDYKGLYNRSKHTANLSIQYTNNEFKASGMLSVKYRGRYGFQGINNYVDGNTILDAPGEFAEGYALVDLVLCKELNKQFSMQAGVDNILNYTQPALLPAQFGRGYFINLNFKL